MARIMFVFWLIGSICVNAQVEIKVGTKYTSVYVGTNEAVFDSTGALQTSIIVSKGFLYAGIWFAQDFDRIADFGNEVDYILGVEHSFRGCSFDVSVTYIDAFKLFALPDGDVIFTAVSISRDFSLGKSGQVIRPFVECKLPIPARGKTPEGGILTYAGMAHSLKLPAEITLVHSARVLYDSGAFGFSHGWLGRYELGLSRKISGNLLISTFTRIGGPLQKKDSRTREVVSRIGISWSFQN